MISILKTSSITRTVNVSVASGVSISYKNFIKMGKLVILNFIFKLATDFTGGVDAKIMQLSSPYDYPIARVNTSCTETWVGDRTGIVYADAATGEIRVVMNSVEKDKMYIVNLAFFSHWG